MKVSIVDFGIFIPLQEQVRPRWRLRRGCFLFFRQYFLSNEDERLLVSVQVHSLAIDGLLNGNPGATRLLLDLAEQELASDASHFLDAAELPLLLFDDVDPRLPILLPR